MTFYGNALLFCKFTIFWSWKNFSRHGDKRMRLKCLCSFLSFYFWLSKESVENLKVKVKRSLHALTMVPFVALKRTTSNFVTIIITDVSCDNSPKNWSSLPCSFCRVALDYAYIVLINRFRSNNLSTWAICNRRRRKFLKISNVSTGTCIDRSPIIFPRETAPKWEINKLAQFITLHAVLEFPWSCVFAELHCC